MKIIDLMESECILKLVELRPVREINSREINDNTENFIAVKETGKNRKTKLNHQQDYRIPLRNSFGIFLIEECQEKPKPTDEDNSMLSLFDHALSKRRQKNQTVKHSKQPEANITSEQYEESLEQRKARIVPSGRTYSEATKFGKKVCVIGNSHLNRIKRNIFQKMINGGKHTLMFF